MMVDPAQFDVAFRGKRMGKIKTAQQIVRKRRLHAVGPDDTVRKACRIMTNRGIGAMPVIDENNQLLGMISERDVVRRCIGENRRVAVTPVRDAMTLNPIFAEPDDTLFVCVAKMMQDDIRHLPVVRGGEVIGCVSIREVVSEISYVTMMNMGMIDEGLPRVETELA
ncbi:MAG: CBS domain-containing protein [Thalassovita sp.]|nr:CBS domain-containing protein [Thalassovita sp.]